MNHAKKNCKSQPIFDTIWSASCIFWWIKCACFLNYNTSTDFPLFNVYINHAYYTLTPLYAVSGVYRAAGMSKANIAAKLLCQANSTNYSTYYYNIALCMIYHSCTIIPFVQGKTKCENYMIFNNIALQNVHFDRQILLYWLFVLYWRAFIQSAIAKYMNNKLSKMCKKPWQNKNAILDNILNLIANVEFLQKSVCKA